MKTFLKKLAASGDLKARERNVLLLEGLLTCLCCYFTINGVLSQNPNVLRMLAELTLPILVIVLCEKWISSLRNTSVEEKLESLKSTQEGTRAELDQALRQHEVRLQDIQVHVSQNVLSELRVGVFDNLLVYLPMYLADTAGYFAQEGITVKYSLHGNDSKVAQALLDGKIQLGACDPTVACLQQDTVDKNNIIRILAPLTRSVNARLVTHDGNRAQMRYRTTGGKFTLACYPEPSTSFVIASWFKKEVEKQHAASGAEVEIHISQLPYDHRLFTHSKQQLDIELEQYDFVLLWDPLLSLALTLPSIKPFAPFDDLVAQLGGHSGNPARHMFSAALTVDNFLRDHPRIIRGVYRSLARASLRLRVPDENDLLVEAVQKHAVGNNGPHEILSKTDLRPIIGKLAIKELFPFLDARRQSLIESEWIYDLRNAFEMRSAVYPTDPALKSISVANDCTGFFLHSPKFNSF